MLSFLMNTVSCELKHTAEHSGTARVKVTAVKFVYITDCQ